MSLRLPFAWLEKPVPAPTRQAISSMREHGIAAMATRSYSLSECGTFPADSFLMTAYAQVEGETDTLSWPEVPEDIRRAIGFHAVEISWNSIGDLSNHKHLSQIHQEDDVDAPYYHAFLTDVALVLVAETRFGKYIDETDPEDFTQEMIDKSFQVLIFEPEVKSSHALLALQTRMNTAFDEIIACLVPQEIDIAPPLLTSHQGF